MRLRTLARAAARLAAGLLLAGSAQAQVIQGSFTGVVIAGSGTGGGVALSSFVGQSMAGSFSFNLGALNSPVLGDGVTSNVFLGSYVAPGLAFTVSQTVAGHTFDFVGTWSSRIDVHQGSWGQAIQFLALGADQSMTWFGVQNALGMAYLSDFGDPASIAFAETGHPSYGANVSSLDASGLNQYTFEITSMSAAVAPVPEPETYALMLAGLGVLVWSRRRRSEAVPS